MGTKYDEHWKQRVKEGMQGYLDKKTEEVRSFLQDEGHEEYLDILTPNERDTILRFAGIGCEPETLQEIADDKDCTPQAIYIYKKRAKEKLIDEKNKASIYW
jgi:DNA-directed RNA polymerase sigma subunit (sigma70/sigma32)